METRTVSAPGGLCVRAPTSPPSPPGNHAPGIEGSNANGYLHAIATTVGVLLLRHRPAAKAARARSGQTLGVRTAPSSVLTPTMTSQRARIDGACTSETSTGKQCTGMRGTVCTIKLLVSAYALVSAAAAALVHDAM